MTSTRKPRVWLWLIVLLPAAIVGTGVLLLGLGFVFNASGESEPFSADERDLLLDVGHLSQWMDGYDPVEGAERVGKTRYFDGSYALEYVYDVADDEAPFLTYSITYEGDERDAQTTFTSFWGGTRVGFLVGEGDVDVHESDELLRWGDESNFGILTADGRPFGNVFLARNGTCVVYFLVAGLYFDDAESVEALLRPYLDRL